MPERIKQLRHDIQDYLDEEIRSKNAEDRSHREELILEAGQTFMDLLNRQNRAVASERENVTDRELTALLRSYRGLGEVSNGIAK